MSAAVAVENDESREREHGWIRAARAGDTDAFRRIVELYQARVFTFILRMVKQREEAEDLAQEAFVRAWRHLANYDERWAFSTWMFTIARNLALNSLRRPRAKIVSIDGTDEEGRARLELPDTGASPADRAIAGERKRRLAEAIESLAPRSAMIFTLFYQEEMPIAEIARTVGMKAGAVKVALHRARAVLREQLAEAPG